MSAKSKVTTAVWRGTVALSLLIAGLNTHAVEITGGTESDRQRMAEISDEWLAAYASGNLDAIMAIMHPDGVLMPHNQPTSRGAQAIRAYFEPRIGKPGVEFVNDLEEIRINGSWAYVLGGFAVQVAAEGNLEPVVVHNGRYLVLYEKVDGEWLMLRDMDNLDPVGDGATAGQ
ncbi:MAG: nuclear transport factor 2 family protein [Pseudomonadota bacterium]